MEILGFGTYDRRRHPRVAVLLDGFRDSGDRVREANSPLPLRTDDRVELLRRPWLVHRLVCRLAHCWLEVARAARRSGRPPEVVVVGYLGHFDVILARLLFAGDRRRWGRQSGIGVPRPVVVLDQLVFGADTARDRGVTSRPVLAALQMLDRLACRCADVVVVDTDESAALVPATYAAKSLVVAVGATAGWFAAGRRAAGGSDRDGAGATGSRAGAPPDAGEGPLRAVFFGLYTPLQGATHLGQALRLLGQDAGVTVTMVGTGQERPAARAAAGPNGPAIWLDWVDPDELPDLVAGHDVCLGIFGTTPKAGRVVPNKVFQGAAAGCAVLTSGTGPQRRALGPAALYVPAGDPEAIAAALTSLAADRDQLERAREAAGRLAAERFTPRAVVEPLRRRLLDVGCGRDYGQA